MIIFVILDSPPLLSKLCATQARKQGSKEGKMSWLVLYMSFGEDGQAGKRKGRKEGSSRDWLIGWEKEGKKEEKEEDDCQHILFY